MTAPNGDGNGNGNGGRLKAMARDKESWTWFYRGIVVLFIGVLAFDGQRLFLKVDDLGDLIGKHSVQLAALIVTVDKIGGDMNTGREHRDKQIGGLSEDIDSLKIRVTRIEDWVQNFTDFVLPGLRHAAPGNRNDP